MKRKQIIDQDGVARWVIGRKSSKDKSEGALWEDSSQKAQTGKTKASLYLWSCVTAVLLISPVVLFLIFSDNDEVVGVQAPNVLPVQKEEFEVSAKEALEAFVYSESIDERLQWAWKPGETKAKLEAYPEQARCQLAEKIALGVAPDDISNGKLTSYEITFADGSVRRLQLVKTTKGYKVDWDCYAQYGTASWDDILKGSVEAAEVRVYMRRSDYFSFNYRDETLWSCYEIIYSAESPFIYAYAHKGSITDKILQEQVDPVKNEFREITMKLSGIKDGFKHKQVKLDRVLAIGWSVQDENFEKNRGQSFLYEEPPAAPQLKTGDVLDYLKNS